MFKTLRFHCCLLSLSLLPNLSQADIIPPINQSGDYWVCTAIDEEYLQWNAQGTIQRLAINKAFDACKKGSRHPATCKTSTADCEAFINGFSMSPRWQCTALDIMAKSWPSNIYRKRDDAALAAKAYCEQNSGFPDTCYVHLMTCKDLNNRGQ